MNKKNLFIISGGQSGTDRAALDFALKHKMKCGGWCPAGRMAEDGRIAGHYPLKETESPEPEERTQKNVDDSNGTLIICLEAPDKGTQFTLDYAKSTRKPVYIIKKDDAINKNELFLWLEINHITKLNIAGPRESNAPGVYDFTKKVLKQLLQ